MSGASDTAPTQTGAKQVTGDHFHRRFQWNIDWITRPLFGFALAGLAVAATIHGGLVFVIFISLVCAAAIREWHRLFARQDYLLPTIITVLAMLGALLWRLEAPSSSAPPWPYWPFAILLVGSLCNLLLGASRREALLAHAAGSIYIGLPVLSLLMIRQAPLHPVWLVVLTFLVVWATDTGALFSGNLIGGPKLAPRLSPNKTWAGFFGGLLCAAIMSAAVAMFLHARIWPAVAFGLVLSLSGQLGDLFESFVKRRVGRKDSGGLIPGHGGVLDRIDSILLAAPVAAIAVLLLGFDPLTGVHP
jgi:phosphatidate cytidylyltransferase